MGKSNGVVELLSLGWVGIVGVCLAISISSAVLIFLLAACSARDIIGKSYDAAMVPSELPYLSKPSPSTISLCNKAYSVKEGETCYAVMKMFKVNEKNFYSINPNVECDHIFVGQRQGRRIGKLETVFVIA